MFEITCLDNKLNPITHLTQWDVNQTLLIDLNLLDLANDNAPIIHFCNKESEKALCVKSTIVDNKLSVHIPNDLLRVPLKIIVYLYLQEDSSGKTIYTIEIPVKKRPQPEGYIYTDDLNIITFENILKEIDNIRKEHIDNKKNPHSVTKTQIGLPNVENKSSATIRSEITQKNITDALGYNPARLDENGLIPSSQLPSYVDDVIEGYYYNAKFYKESVHTTIINGETGKIYVDLSTSKTYRWSGSMYILLNLNDNEYVTGIKGNNETSYRKGNVNLTCDNIGAASKDLYNKTSINIGRKAGSEVGMYSFAMGVNPIASGNQAFAFGQYVAAIGNWSHAEGYGNNNLGSLDFSNLTDEEIIEAWENADFMLAKTQGAYAQGANNLALGYWCHAEGGSNIAKGHHSHAEGNYNRSLGRNSHAEGNYNRSLGRNSHTEGEHNRSLGRNSHTEGEHNVASANNTHTSGYYTKAAYNEQFVVGLFNDNKDNTLFEIGNGTSDTKRSNAFEVDKQGNGTFTGNVVAKNTEDTGWMYPTKESLFSNYADNTPLKIRRIGKIVNLQGILKNRANMGAEEQPIKVFTIPEEFRPSQRLVFVQQGSGSNRFILDINTNGVCYIDRYSNNATVQNIISVGSWLNCNATWFVD